jgi:hypothetical protein
LREERERGVEDEQVTTLTRRHRRDELAAAMQQHPQHDEPRHGTRSEARRPHRRARTRELNRFLCSRLQAATMEEEAISS